MHHLSDPIFINRSDATLNGSRSNEVRNNMIIKSLRVQNFRCICDETLPCEQLTVLVGRNGSGKSAFLHALNAFYNANSRYTEEDFYGRDTSQDIIITVTFNDLTDDERTLFQKYVEAKKREVNIMHPGIVILILWGIIGGLILWGVYQSNVIYKLNSELRNLKKLRKQEYDNNNP